MRKLLFALAASAAVLASGAASADTLDFETPDVAAFERIGPSYAGYTFTNWAVVDGPGYGASGYANVITSGQQSACGCASDFGEIYSSISNGTAFDLIGGNFASAWNDGATLLVEGYRGASLLYSQSFVLNTTGPSALTFGFTGIDLVNFSISGGTPSGLSGSGNYFGVDDLQLAASSGVPEPATWALMIMGFGAAGAALRRKKATVSYA
ncbi:hypothetical protein ASG29_08710 [Sphingomonas sp. Leaf412]|uniref:PEPxxWA-CTERM sorting domain-containing protein n=1 Tax=Sphingomonas sp. Leaf412 TaxID=1736370 RepID=UPI0006FAF172|nr:PEPxxWA-CTERM sorting domain-containing protein [Sphingomonas sp. Leaf412]KQT31941.1 hypothetical protein ASG29_08710 [Sphingomonas sp. Leaf412]